MAVSFPGSGSPISLLDLQNYFGGDSPISFSEYLQAVEGIGDSTSGASLNEFYGKSGYYGDRAVLVGGRVLPGDIEPTHPVTGAPTFPSNGTSYQQRMAFGQTIDITTTGNATMYGLPNGVDPSFPPGTSQVRPRAVSPTGFGGHGGAMMASNRSLGMYGDNYITTPHSSQNKDLLAYTSFINPETTFGDYGYQFEMGISNGSVSNGNKAAFQFGRRQFKTSSNFSSPYIHFWSQAFQVTIGTSGAISAIAGYDMRPGHWGVWPVPGTSTNPNTSPNPYAQPNVQLGQIGYHPDFRGDLHPASTIFDRIWAMDDLLHTHTAVGNASGGVPSNPDGSVNYLGNAAVGIPNGVRGAFLDMTTSSAFTVKSNYIKTFNIENPEARAVHLGELSNTPWDPQEWDTVSPSSPTGYLSNLFGQWNSPGFAPGYKASTEWTYMQRTFYSGAGGKNRAIVAGGRDFWEKLAPLPTAQSPTSGSFFAQNMGTGMPYYSRPLISNRIDYFDINKTGNSADFGNLYERRQQHSSTTNGDRVLFIGGNSYYREQTNIPAPNMGGYSPNPFATANGMDLTTPANDPASRLKSIDYINIHTLGNAADFGDLTHSLDLLVAGSGSTTA